MAESVLILGAGNFGTCLAHHLSVKCSPAIFVDIWTRTQAIAEHINLHHKNPKYLNQYMLHPRVRGVHDLKELNWQEYRYIVFAIPTQNTLEVLTSILPFVSSRQIIISTAKGIEQALLKFPSQMISETILKERNIDIPVVVLSGPSFAVEIIQELPTCVSLACIQEWAAIEVQNLFHTPKFRCYTSQDPIGLEVAGALKNVIAIAAGACEGLGLQNNARASLITRGLAEITRFGTFLGANPLTFNGLGGVGDLLLTCTSMKSRNFQVGFLLGQGMNFEEAISKIGSVAEGVTTVKSAYFLAQKWSLDAPMITEVYNVIYLKKPIKDAVSSLLTRDPKPEILFATPSPLPGLI